MKIALYGIGTVGGGVVKVLADNQAQFQAKYKEDLVITHVLTRDPDKVAGFAHNAVQQPMFFQMLPVFLTVIAFVGIDGRTFGNAFQQRRQMVALMGIGQRPC